MCYVMRCEGFLFCLAWAKPVSSEGEGEGGMIQFEYSNISSDD